MDHLTTEPPGIIPIRIGHRTAARLQMALQSHSHSRACQLFSSRGASTPGLCSSSCNALNLQDQQPEVTDSPEYGLQSGLVRNRACQCSDCCAIPQSPCGDRNLAKPVRPALAEPALHFDAVCYWFSQSKLVINVGWHSFSTRVSRTIYSRTLCLHTWPVHPAFLSDPYLGNPSGRPLRRRIVRPVPL